MKIFHKIFRREYTFLGLNILLLDKFLDKLDLPKFLHTEDHCTVLSVGKSDPVCIMIVKY